VSLIGFRVLYIIFLLCLCRVEGSVDRAKGEEYKDGNRWGPT
jgi:hypothetical protein